MKLILTYQGTVKLAGNQVSLAGYEIGEDASKLNEMLASFLDSCVIDSAETSTPVDRPEVTLSLQLVVLPSSPISNGSNGNAGSSPVPTMTASATTSPASGGSSPPSGGPKTGGGATPAQFPSASHRAGGK